MVRQFGRFCRPWSCLYTTELRHYWVTPAPKSLPRVMRHKLRNPSHSRRTARSLRREDLWVRVIAATLCAVTFPLLWVGGLVTTTKAGMAVPDWPGTYGDNLLLYPWETWLAAPWDLFIEHGHRLLATLAGLLTILLLVLLVKFDERKWMHWVGVAALAGVIAQGVLGGLRVLLDERLLAMVHGSTGPLFFALTLAVAIWTSSMWRTAAPTGVATGLHRWVPLGLVACILVYVQMVLGAALRHMPVTASPHSFAAAVKAHLCLAIVVAVASGIIAWHATRPPVAKPIRRCGIGLAAVVTLQIVFGVLAWLTKYATPQWASGLVAPSATATIADGWWQAHIVTAHQATGSLLLGVMLATTMLAWRYSPAPAILSTSIVLNPASKGAAAP